ERENLPPTLERAALAHSDPGAGPGGGLEGVWRGSGGGLEGVLWRCCRTRSNTALEQRITAWEPRRVSRSRAAQETALKAIRAEDPEYAALHTTAMCCHDVLARLDTPDQAFVRRSARGEQAGFPRCNGR